MPELLKGTSEPTIIHTDQGSVYSSKAYNELIKDTNIVRSMSRAGKPTDNPVNYRKRIYKGEIAYKNTFKDRVLSETPKFVQKRYNNAIPESVSTLENENDEKNVLRFAQFSLQDFEILGYFLSQTAAKSSRAASADCSSTA